jgi:hypothetical protein
MGGARRLALATLALLQAACLVEIHHVREADAAFRAAREEVAREQGRPGRPHRLNVLVFDPSDGELVKVSMPLWLARKVQGHIHWQDDDGGGDTTDRVARRLARRVTVDDLAKAGRGLLADVEDDDGSQVLVWLR